MALHPARGGGSGPFPGEDSDLERPGRRGLDVEAELVPSEVGAAEVAGPRGVVGAEIVGDVVGGSVEEEEGRDGEDYDEEEGDGEVGVEVEEWFLGLVGGGGGHCLSLVVVVIVNFFINGLMRERERGATGQVVFERELGEERSKVCIFFGALKWLLVHCSRPM